MNHFSSFRNKISIYLLTAMVTPGVIGVCVYMVLEHLTDLQPVVSLVVAGTVYAIAIVAAHSVLLDTSLRPLEMIWQAVWHISPEKNNAPAPKLKEINVGRELVASTVSQIYDFVSSNKNAAGGQTNSEALDQRNEFIESLPVSVFILDKDWNIKTANKSAVSYLDTEPQKVVGRNVNDILHLSFSSEDTLDSWLEDCVENKATDSHTWEHAKLTIDGKKVKQFDMAASYSKDNVSGNEVVLVIFDRENIYSVADQASSYVTLAVHELRTPLTMLRGYIELFEDEIGEQLDDEHKEFMRKMSVSAQNLSAFVNNILNVAKLDENELVLNLHEADWGQSLTEVIESLSLRAEVKGKHISLETEPGMPAAGIDQISMHEVVTNLIDNAIKYSGQSSEIVVRAGLNSDGDIETTVQDQGNGIPESVIGELFTKFYRSHRSKNAVPGSGLGLYLVKSIVAAHGGNVWVKSKEGQGSTFGFTLQPYAKINEESKGKANEGIERQAGGWIKNHSLYRR